MISLGFAFAATVLLFIGAVDNYRKGGTLAPLLFEFCFGTALFSGLAWWPVFATPEAFAVSLCFIVFAFAMGGTAIFAMFREAPEE